MERTRLTCRTPGWPGTGWRTATDRSLGAFTLRTNSSASAIQPPPMCNWVACISGGKATLAIDTRASYILWTCIFTCLFRWSLSLESLPLSIPLILSMFHRALPLLTKFCLKCSSCKSIYFFITIFSTNYIPSHVPSKLMCKIACWLEILINI